MPDIKQVKELTNDYQLQLKKKEKKKDNQSENNQAHTTLKEHKHKTDRNNRTKTIKQK